MVCCPAGRITLGEVEISGGVTDAAVDVLAENVGVTGVPGYIDKEVNDHSVERGMSPVLWPPMNLADSVELKRFESGIGVICRAAEEVHYLVSGLIGGNPKIRIGVIAAFCPRRRNARGATETVTKVAELHVGNMFDDAKQIGPGGDLGASGVVFAYPVELGCEGVTLYTQIPMECFLLRHDDIVVDIGHAYAVRRRYTGTNGRRAMNAAMIASVL